MEGEGNKSAQTVRLILFYYSGIAIYNIFLSFLSGIVAAYAQHESLRLCFATFATAGYLGAVWLHARFHEHEFIFITILGFQNHAY